MVFQKQTRRKLTAALVVVMCTGGQLASAQSKVSPQKKSVAKATPFSISSAEEARLKQYLDKNGGYREKSGGYFDPKAGTYQDNDGGFVDNWKGYTYKDGSYKSGTGNYYDAPKRTVHLASGDTVKLPDGNTSAEAIKVLRDDVEQNHGYDKDFVYKSMMEQIEKEHPPVAKSSAH